MRVLIVSDTHKHDENLMTVLAQIGAIDMLIHLGDAEGSEDYIREVCQCPLHIVAGNNDFFSELPREMTIDLAGHKILITHGHYYYVSMGIQRLKEEALARGYDIVMFGHTHKPLLEIESTITALNPGSLSYPRQEGRKPSFILMDVAEDGQVQFDIRYL